MKKRTIEPGVLVTTATSKVTVLKYTRNNTTLSPSSHSGSARWEGFPGQTLYAHASKSDAALAGQIYKTREEGGALRKGRGHQGGGGQRSGRSRGGAGKAGRREQARRLRPSRLLPGMASSTV